MSACFRKNKNKKLRFFEENIHRQKKGPNCTVSDNLILLSDNLSMILANDNLNTMLVKGTFHLFEVTRERCILWD